VYRVRWYEAAGRERSRSFDSRADAKAFDGKVRTLKRSDGLAQLDAGTETFAEFAAEWWELYAKPNLERATLSNYASVFNKHLLPRIGHMRLRDLSVPTLMRLRADLEADGVGRQAVRKVARGAAEHPPAGRGVGADRIESGALGAETTGAARPGDHAARARGG